MTRQALYRKWRSQTFAEIVGQHHVTDTLVNALKLDRVTHAYLFAGPRGTGKTSTARLLAKAVNCLAEEPAQRPCNQCSICVAINEGRLLDLIEIDAASNTGVDDIRDLRDKVNFRPAEARIKFYIIDEVHMLSNSAFNALLKTLEEPPGHVIFVLATTEPEKIPATITSRCQRFDFKRIKLDDIVERLSYIAAEEGFTVERTALEHIARQGSGSMRDAISLFDQLTAYGHETITLELVQDVLGVRASRTIMELVEALINQDVAAGLDVINRVIDDGADPRQYAREIIEYLRAVMLAKLGNGARLLNLPDETLARVKEQAGLANGPALVRATTLFNEALFELKSGLLTVPQLSLELAFIEAVMPTRNTPLPEPAVTAPEAGWSQQTTSAPPPPSAGLQQETVRVESGLSQRSKPEAATKPLADTVSGLDIPAPAEVVADEGGALTLEIVRDCFDSVVRTIEPKSKPMAEALRNTRLYRVSGREIHLITFDMFKERFEKPQPKAAIDAAFSQVIGKSVTVRFLSEKTVPASASPVGGRGSDRPTENEELKALLKTAEELGGEVDSQFLS